MPERRAALRYGRIIYTWISDRAHHAKLRPALVLTPDDQISADAPIVVAAITTTFPEPPPLNCVTLPWHPAGRVGTALRRRSAAVVNWLAEIRPADVVGYGGDVPYRIMNVIEKKIDELPEE